MGLSVVRAEIHRFLTAAGPEVLALKGGWGTGKTFTWKKLATEHAKTEAMPTERYSYVSLFGVNSLEEFKYLLFQQAVPNDTVGLDPTLSSFRDNAVSFSELLGRKGFGWFEKLPFLRGFSGELRSLAFLALRNTLICIDDLERKGNNLSVKDVLGLISQLKEEKNCKVVVILNDGGLENDDVEQFSRYREKVIDIELRFEPTVEECVEIALDPDNDIDNEIRERILQLGIRNIRIIFRVKRLVALMAPHLSSSEPEVLSQTIHTLTLLTWCYLSDDDGAPSYEYVTHSHLSLLGLEHEERTDQEKSWNAILQNYQFLYADEYDLALANVVETGYVVDAQLAKPLEALNAQVRANKGDKSFEEAWRLYHDSFEDNQDEVIALVYERFKENVQYISPLNLNGTVSLLRELGREDLANDCIQYYVTQRAGESSLFNMDDYPFSSEITDERIREEFANVFLQHAPTKTLREVVADISERRGWGKADIEVMSNAAEDDYYALFKNESGPHLRPFVNACLQFRAIVNAGQKERSISTKAEAALRKIAAESAINRRRVASYGVQLDGAEQGAASNESGA